MTSLLARVRASARLVLLLCLTAGRLAGQVPAESALQGQVLRGEGDPVPGATVVLHRVGEVIAGEIDSIRTASDGSFRLPLPRVPDPGAADEVYFASVRHQGVLYFGFPVTTAAEADSTYLIQVYDTLVAPPQGADLTPRVRYILAEEIPDGYQITDLVQLDVQGDRTWVAADSGYTWSYPLPEGIRNVQVGGGDLSPDAAVYDQGVLRISSSLSPGPRQLVVRYFVDSLFLSIPVPGGVQEMDFLVRQPGPEVQIQGLIPAEVVEMEGVAYQRFAGTEMDETTVVVTSSPQPWAPSPRWLAVGMGLLLALGGLYFGLRRGPTGQGASGGSPSGTQPPEGGASRAAAGAGAGPVGTTPTRQSLLTEVARVDLALEQATGEAERARLEARRAQLLDELRRQP